MNSNKSLAITPTVQAEIAEQAAELVEQGWVQHNYYGPQGEVCAMGALSQSISLSSAITLEQSFRLASIMKREANEAVRKWYRVEYTQLWNDEPGRTQAEVVDFWKRMAKEYANATAEPAGIANAH